MKKVFEQFGDVIIAVAGVTLLVAFITATLVPEITAKISTLVVTVMG